MELTAIPMESLAELLLLQMENGGVARLIVTGNSMYPTLRHRKDTVFLRPAARALERGDLILYRRQDGAFVLHRIVTRPRKNVFFCAGDNQWRREPVNADQVLAVADGFIRKGKTYKENNCGYRLWVAVWLLLLPLRRPILAFRRFLGRIRRRKNKR